MKRKKYFVVRNLQKQFIATYFATTARDAIAMHLRDQQVYNSQFRRSRMKAETMADFTAAVEPKAEHEAR